MFIDTIDEQHPERVLKSIRMDLTGFLVVFDLPNERTLEITINAFTKEDGTIEVYEHLKGMEPYRRYWLINSNHFIVSGTDPLPLLESYLETAIGGIEHGYEGSFATMLLERALQEVSNAKEKSEER